MSQTESTRLANLSRRRFLKISLLAAGSMTLGGPQVLRTAGASSKPVASRPTRSTHSETSCTTRLDTRRRVRCPVSEHPRPPRGPERL
jgi:anaerobic selenocysteine-containing dehydrogenase